MSITKQGQTIALTDGVAEYMGDGFTVVMQRDEYGKAHSVALSREDLRKLLEVEG